MIKSIADSDQQQKLPSSYNINYEVTYDLAPSQQQARIRLILAARKRKSRLLLSSPLNTSSATDASGSILGDSKASTIKKKQRQVFDDYMLNGGLPSPVDSPKAEFPSVNNYDDHSAKEGPMDDDSNDIKGENDLSVKDIESRLAALRKEKHGLFQLMKRLVEEEEQKQAMKNQQQTKKRKASRWVPVSLETSSGPKSYGSHGYFGQQPVIHHPPYLY